MRISIPTRPYPEEDANSAWDKRGRWPCSWIAPPDSSSPPFVTAYRRAFDLDHAATLRVHVTADERYELFVDGERVGRGSERGDADHWFFETYDLTFQPGPHILVARVWSLGEGAPFAQMSAHSGFLLSPDAAEYVPLLGTGVAEWHVKRLGGYTFQNPMAAWGTGQNVVVEGASFDWGFETGQGDRWREAVVCAPAVSAPHFSDLLPIHFLEPATLPPMLEVDRRPGTIHLVADIPVSCIVAGVPATHAIPIRSADNLPEDLQAWNGLWKGGLPLAIPALTRRRVLIDLEDYYCAYPQMVVSGGAGSRVRIHWQETLFNEANTRTKGNRNAIEGKYFVTIWWNQDGIGDTFLPDGGSQRHYETLWWQCGRYVEIVVETGDEPLVIEQFSLRETRYPFERENSFEASDPRLAEVIPLATRALQMCSHETYMDCPYFEQLMYVGDTRLQALTTYVSTVDDRLPRKAIAMFDWSRLNSGITQSRYPTRVRQVIPPFSLWWIAMIHDYALWRGDKNFVAARMPGARNVLDAYRSWRNADGLIQAPDGWNYMDWVPEWESGIPPDGACGVSSVLNLHFVHVLRLAAELETWLGEPEMAARNRREADAIFEKVHVLFWDEGRGLIADDIAHSHYSEHAQCLALLAGGLSETQIARVGAGLLTAPDLARTTIYFTHYLFETYYLLGRTEALLQRMDLWFALKAAGLKTTVEMPEPTRSDCHAWGAHPLYHYFASLIGLRPAGPGASEVRIAPQPGPLKRLRGILPHPKGEIAIWLHRDQTTLSGDLTLPEGMTGTFVYNGHVIQLAGGRQIVTVPEEPGS